LTARSARAAAILGELPPGTVEVGRRSLQTADRYLRQATGAGAVDDSAAAVEAHLVRPVELAEDWPDPTPPLPVGDGAVHADLIDDDLELFATLRSVAVDSADYAETPAAETLAARAQTWRLPVTPYRRRIDAAELAGQRCDRYQPTAPKAGGRTRLVGCRVVDLSALWAGPLATSLLAEVGVEVIKIDPSCRPDAFAEHPALYDHLNGAKEIIDLDLRVDGDRHRFEDLVRSADLIVDSFSRRVMPNLGYGPGQLRALRPSIASLSIVAFDPLGPNADWVAYGPGVHAMSGLADRTRPEDGDGARPTFRAAPIAYPDALAGLAAFAAAVELLADGGATAHRTISLETAIAPLVAKPDA